jgi:hypothetical protein
VLPRANGLSGCENSHLHDRQRLEFYVLTAEKPLSE